MTDQCPVAKQGIHVQIQVAAADFQQLICRVKWIGDAQAA